MRKRKVNRRVDTEHLPVSLHLSAHRNTELGFEVTHKLQNSYNRQQSLLILHHKPLGIKRCHDISRKRPSVSGSPVYCNLPWDATVIYSTAAGHRDRRKQRRTVCVTDTAKHQHASLEETPCLSSF